jgi:hypothetical protein
LGWNIAALQAAARPERPKYNRAQGNTLGNSCNIIPVALQSRNQLRNSTRIALCARNFFGDSGTDAQVIVHA